RRRAAIDEIADEEQTIDARTIVDGPHELSELVDAAVDVADGDRSSIVHPLLRNALEVVRKVEGRFLLQLGGDDRLVLEELVEVLARKDEQRALRLRARGRRTRPRLEERDLAERLTRTTYARPPSR